jgi:peptidoglycan/xylan/chitin deacetylase (PgdA/CDA1 family)
MSMLMLDNTREISFSLAEKTGMLAFLLALLCAFLSPALAIIPLVFFLLLCLGAPFFPRFSFFLPVISQGKEGTGGVALTFDDGPSPVSTPIILDLLAHHDLQATFFVVGEKAAAYPHLVKDILDQGHTIGNHSWNHDFFLMLRSQKTLQKDIHKTQEILATSGIHPRFFRPPAGVTSSRLARVLIRENMITVTYSCRAFDRGNRNVHNLAVKILSRLHPGDIIMLHDLPPYQKNQTDYWQKELDHLFMGLKEKYDIVPLQQII